MNITKDMCEHKLVHLETKKENNYEVVTGNVEWIRTDIFYCEKCGEIITRQKSEWSRKTPDWY